MPQGDRRSSKVIYVKACLCIFAEWILEEKHVEWKHWPRCICHRGIMDPICRKRCDAQISSLHAQIPIKTLVYDEIWPNIPSNVPKEDARDLVGGFVAPDPSTSLSKIWNPK